MAFQRLMPIEQKYSSPMEAMGIPATLAMFEDSTISQPFPSGQPAADPE